MLFEFFFKLYEMFFKFYIEIIYYFHETPFGRPKMSHFLWIFLKVIK